MRCPKCDAWATPDMSVCRKCGAALVQADSVVEKYQRQIRASRARWSAEAPGLVGSDSFVSGEALSGRPEECRVEVETFGVLNFLLLHAGYSPFRHLAVRGPVAGLRSARLKISAQPSVVHSKTIVLADFDGKLDPPPALEVDYDAFLAFREAVPGRLQLTVSSVDASLHTLSHSLTVQDPGEWINAVGCEAALAGAVTPNAPAVDGFVGGLSGDFVAYQADDPGRVRAEVARVYEAVGRLGLRYVGAAPSFEGTGQKVLFPDQVLSLRRGCCVDLAVLEAAIHERLGLNPLVIFLRDRDRGTGHVLSGVWASNIRARHPVLRDPTVVRDMVAEGELLVWDPTDRFTRGEGDGISSAVETAVGQLERFEFALDVAGSRQRGIKPVPRIIR